jgi:two-component SAPR family response regulator
MCHAVDETNDKEGMVEQAGACRQKRQTNLPTQNKQPLVHVFLLGGLRLDWQVPPAEESEAWQSRTSARDLFLLLLCMPGRQATRSQLAGTLWPETEERKA